MTWLEVLKNILIALVPATAVAIITANITVKKSLRQFRSQKWWEKKAETYSAISEDLSRLFFCTKELYSDSVGEVNLDDHRIKTLDNEHGRRLESFKMILAGGAFIVSKEVHKEIEALIKNLDSNNYNQQKESFAEYLGRDWDSIEKFKDKFNELAKKDLSIN